MSYSAGQGVRKIVLTFRVLRITIKTDCCSWAFFRPFSISMITWIQILSDLFFNINYNRYTFFKVNKTYISLYVIVIYFMKKCGAGGVPKISNFRIFWVNSYKFVFLLSWRPKHTRLAPLRNNNHLLYIFDPKTNRVNDVAPFLSFPDLLN